jgi:pilus assembly protein CpaB
MRPKSLLLLALALGCGLIASIGISQVMESNKRGPGGEEKEAIYVAKVNINTGDPINTEMVMLKEWPKADIPPGAIRELTNLEDRRPRTPVFQGEPILESKLLNPGEKAADPTQHIPKGYRIVPISVRADTGAAGLLRPGDRVDVQWYVARNLQIGVNETVTKTILHNIRVFAVDQTVTRPVNGDEAPTLAKTISLLLTPKQANTVQLASKMGEVSLIPRNPDDPSVAEASRVTFDDLVGNSNASGSRTKEQEPQEDTHAAEAEGGFLSSLMNKVASAAAASAVADIKPPFEMELVLGDQVHHRMFDAVSGKPLRELMQAESGGDGAGMSAGGAGESELEGARIPMNTPGPRSEAEQGPGVRPTNEGADEGSDFPIDFAESEQAPA